MVQQNWLTEYRPFDGMDESYCSNDVFLLLFLIAYEATLSEKRAGQYGLFLWTCSLSLIFMLQVSLLCSLCLNIQLWNFDFSAAGVLLGDKHL
jgi:hypothetical protein